MLIAQKNHFVNIFLSAESLAGKACLPVIINGWDFLIDNYLGSDAEFRPFYRRSPC